MACARTPRADGVIHLDPRLADGGSSAEVLAGTRVVVADWKVLGVGAELGPWRLTEHLEVPARDGRPGILIGDVEVEKGVFPRVKLVWEGEVLARDFDVLEVDLKKFHAGGVRVSWTRTDDVPDVHFDALIDEDLHGFVVTVPETQEQQVASFALSNHGEWKGTIERITVILATEGPQRFELAGMRFVSVGFQFGADPLESERGDREAHDGGLVARGLEMRRAWPTDWNVPLYGRCRVPRAGLLAVDTSIPASLSAFEGALHFALDVRVPESKWIMAAERVFWPASEDDATRWMPMLADLSRWEGREVELRFRAFGDEEDRVPRAVPEGSDPESVRAAEEERLAEFWARDPRNVGLGGQLLRTRALWGSPRVLGEPSDYRPPDIVLVTIDTLRADRVGALAAGGSTPFLTELSARGLSFSNAWSPSNSTSPAHASILTGLDVLDHGVIDNFSVLAPEVNTLAERLRARGYETAAAVSAPHLQAGRSGLGQGFDRFRLTAAEAPVNGGLTLAAVQSWIDEWTAVGERPLFLWVHFFDPHTPYRSPLPWQSKWEAESGRPRPSADAPVREFPEGPHTRKGEFLWRVESLDYVLWQYDAGVAYADFLTRELCTSLERAGMLRGALVVAGDHGESLGEHGRYFHHTGLYEEVMRVPLIALLPNAPRGQQVVAPASTLDVSATLERLAGLERESRGVDLVELAEGRADPARRLFFSHSHLAQFGSVDERWYFLHTPEDYQQLGPEFFLPAGTDQLFDRITDPALERDVSAEHPSVVAELRRELGAWRAEALGARGLRRELETGEADELRGLGYSGDPRDGE